MFFFVQIVEMSVFPRISLKPEVTDFLQDVFLNKEVGIYIRTKESHMAKILGFSPLFC